MSGIFDQVSEEIFFDLDVLRGWKEIHDDDLRDDHALPALASLICRNADRSKRYEFRIHGPETYVGRYHPQNGPVDIILAGLEDHEVYKLSAPHIRLIMNERGAWTVRPMTPAAITKLNEKTLIDPHRTFSLTDGDELTLGTLVFEFRTTGATYDQWLRAKKKLLVDDERTGVYLMRAGAVCGPKKSIPRSGRLVLGRSFPLADDLASGPWIGHEQPDWDLAGLWDWERKFIGFIHAAIVEADDGWRIEPISERQRTFVNRLEVTHSTPLMPGDEIGMGSVLLHFHDPSDVHASTHSHTAELPAVVTWREESTHQRLPTVKRDSGEMAAIERDGMSDPVTRDDIPGLDALSSSDAEDDEL